MLNLDPSREIATSRRSLFSRGKQCPLPSREIADIYERTCFPRKRAGCEFYLFREGGFFKGAFPMFSRFLFLSMIHLLSTLSLMPRRALPFLPKRKGSKRFASLRGLTAKDSTQRSYVKRGLRLWKQQPKQSPPFGKLSPTHQQTAALQLLEVTPIKQIVPLLNQQGRCICPDRLQNQSLPGRFCLACQDDAPYNSFPPFSHPRRKGGAVCHWHMAPSVRETPHPGRLRGE